jgi:hypothetical protein
LDNFIRGNNFENVMTSDVINKNPESTNLQIVFEYRAISNRAADFDIDRSRDSDIKIFGFIYKRLLLADLYIFPDIKGQRDKISFAIRFIDLYGINA